MFKFIKKNIVYICLLVCFFCTAFCIGRTVRDGILESNRQKLESRTDIIGSSAAAEGIAVEAAGNSLGSAINFSNIAIGNIDAATVYSIELQHQLDEIIGITEAHQAALRLAESSIDDLFELAIRKAELNEEFIEQITELLGNSRESTSK